MRGAYYAVIFTNHQTNRLEGYEDMALRMLRLAEKQPGYLGADSVRNELGITISYWESLDAIAQWKANLEHQEAQKLGKELWYDSYSIRICRVEKEYHFNRGEKTG